MIKGAGITSHFFVISNQRRLIIKQSFNEKRKKDFVFLYITPFLRLYTYKSWSESRSLARSEFVRTKEIKQIKSRTGKGISEIFTFFFLYRAFRENKGVLFMADQWIIGPSWIWTSVDILPTNLQSVPINRSGIDPGKINPGLAIIHDPLPFVVPYPQGKSNPRCLLEREMSWTTRRWGRICSTASILCS